MQWLGDNGEIVVELPREEGDVHLDVDNSSGTLDLEAGARGAKGKGKEKAKVHRFTAVSGTLCHDLPKRGVPGAGWMPHRCFAFFVRASFCCLSGGRHGYL